MHNQSISPCNDCRACKRGDFICTVNDDKQNLYKEIDNTDILILETPIYWFGLTSVMKTILDRFRPYFVNKKLNGKKDVLVLPVG